MIEPPVITHGTARPGPAEAETLPVLMESAAVPPEPIPTLVEGGASTARADWPVNAAVQTDGSVTLMLHQPVALRYKDAQGAVTEEGFASLTMRPLTGEHRLQLRKADNDTFEAIVLSCCTGISLGKMELIYKKMDYRDIAAALRVFRFFTTPGLRTGP